MEQEFHQKYVAPYYMDLMNLNFVYKSKETVQKLINSIKGAGKELDDSTLIEMLNNHWRESKTSAWIIGVCNKNHLIDELLKTLQKQGIQYSEHILLNILILNVTDVKIFETFLNQQIDYFLKTNDIFILENLSIDWGISILNFLDKKNHSNYIKKIKSSKKWIEFIKKLETHKYSDRISDAIIETFENEYHLEEINLMIELNITK